ncbi:hypothetical protein GSI_14790 [Ganoderma sinense ZZ0214-1]|uniref:Uncharacterized protein n=1 Tax=Ganoderma sinense ZZ0214-1 TaxID=1077348 RepID=A0A2G8RPP4_9APHY|nr:hypothetical protein GSI_14790 [Ganoderma sinense ZZ0214-1]
MLVVTRRPNGVLDLPKGKATALCHQCIAVFALHNKQHTGSGRVDCSECESQGFPCVNIADNTDDGTTTPTQRDYSSTSGTVTSDVPSTDTLPPTDRTSPQATASLAPSLLPDDSVYLTKLKTSEPTAFSDYDYAANLPNYGNPFMVSEGTDIQPYSVHPHFPTAQPTYPVVRSPTPYPSLEATSQQTALDYVTSVPTNLTFSTSPSPPLPPVTSIRLPSPVCPVPLRSPGWHIPILQYTSHSRSPTPPRDSFPSFSPCMPVVAGNAFYGYLPQLPLNCTSDVTNAQATLPASQGNSSTIPRLLPLNEHVRILQYRQRERVRPIMPDFGNNDQWSSGYTSSGNGYDNSQAVQQGLPYTINSSFADIPAFTYPTPATTLGVTQPTHAQGDSYRYQPAYANPVPQSSQSAFAPSQTREVNNMPIDDSASFMPR